MASASSQAVLVWLLTHSRQEETRLISAAEAIAKMSRGKCDPSSGWGRQQRGSLPGPCSPSRLVLVLGAVNVFPCGEGISAGQRPRWPWGVQDHSPRGSSGLAFADLNHHAHQHGAHQAGHYSSTILPLPLILALKAAL